MNFCLHLKWLRSSLVLLGICAVFAWLFHTVWMRVDWISISSTDQTIRKMLLPVLFMFDSLNYDYPVISKICTLHWMIEGNIDIQVFFAYFDLLQWIVLLYSVEGRGMDFFVWSWRGVCSCIFLSTYTNLHQIQIRFKVTDRGQKLDLFPVNVVQLFYILYWSSVESYVFEFIGKICRRNS